MATIVEYTDRKQPANQYPHRIISPPRPGACCFSDMAELGTPQTDARWAYQCSRRTACDVAGDVWARARRGTADAVCDRGEAG